MTSKFSPSIKDCSMDPMWLILPQRKSFLHLSWHACWIVTYPFSPQLGYARRSVLAGGWYLASHASTTHPEVCLCGEGRVERHMVRQWVEYYLTRVRTETVWDALSREQLKSVLEVRTLCFLIVKVVRWHTINQSIDQSSISPAGMQPGGVHVLR